MDTEFWEERWRINKIGFHQIEINAHLINHWEKVAPISDNNKGLVFVPLCGKTEDIIWLRSSGHEVIGVEVSPIAVRDFFRENELTPKRTSQGDFERWEADGVTILCGDFFKLGAKVLEGVEYVYDRASLVALPENLRADYANHLAEILPSNVSTLLVSFEYPKGEMDGPPFSVTVGEVLRLFSGKFAVLLLATEDVLEENPGFKQRGLTKLHEHVFRLTSKI